MKFLKDVGSIILVVLMFLGFILLYNLSLRY